MDGCLRNGFKSEKLFGGRFLTVAPLNHGSFGMVFKARDTLTGDDVAIKCITKAGAIKDNPSCLANIAIDDRSEELAIHSRLSEHPNIVNLIECFETEAHQYMVLELCSNGDLYEAIRVGRGPLQTEHVRGFLLELVDAIDHLHTNGVYHRDIKPENIFLTSSGSMKLGDFGLATTDIWSTEFAVGSDRYMAPEQFEPSVYGYGYSPAAADTWAIGIVLLNVLFQRNPFATPTATDPLFADFVCDRQSLFDVFPNMSQDTYNILVHSLAVDPANRSLGAVKEAIKTAVSFTTDDEALDEFCTEQNDLVPVATAAREPLRTPSISSPNMNGDSFPWPTNALKTPQKAARQLSTIHDEEPDLFPGSVKTDWQYVDPDEASLSSNIDSGLGMSYKSTKSTKSFVSQAFANHVGSLPISFTRPGAKLSSPYGANSGFSKSWSDLWDEDEEMQEQGRSSFEAGMDIERGGTAKPRTPQLSAIKEDERGSSKTATPRQALIDSDNNTRSVSPLRQLVEHDKANPESPKQRATSILDRWAALGNFRRAKLEPPLATVAATEPTAPMSPTPQKVTPPKTSFADAFSSFASFGSAKKEMSPSRSRARSNNWRRDSPARLRSTSMHANRINNRKEHAVAGTSQTETPWSLDSNWRQHKHAPTPKTMTHSPVRSGRPLVSTQAPRKYTNNTFLEFTIEDDLDDDETPTPHSFLEDDPGWVGGWRDFHL